ncbi:MAG: adenylate kinase [Acidobacteriota bacterium]|nr:MAG: adenylate kinase [Acidobacteriota bacterium]
MSKIIVMIGAPGAGKGTQARLLSEKYGYPQISTGDILREMAQVDTPEGRELRQIMASGKLVSDDVLADLIERRTSRPDCQNGYILDGYPRTVIQAQQLEEMSAWQKKEVLLVRVVVFEDSLMKRLTGRRTCTRCGEIYNLYFRPPQNEGVCDKDGAPLGQRTDDTSEAVRRRLEEYRSATAPLIDYYSQNGRLIEVDGELPVDEVFDKLCHVIDNFNMQAA